MFKSLATKHGNLSYSSSQHTSSSTLIDFTGSFFLPPLNIGPRFQILGLLLIYTHSLDDPIQSQGFKYYLCNENFQFFCLQPVLFPWIQLINPRCLKSPSQTFASGQDGSKRSQSFFFFLIYLRFLFFFLIFH